MSKQIRLVYPQQFESSNIINAGYCAEAEMLFIGFKDGGTYAYLGFTEMNWVVFTDAIVAGESVGKYFHRLIKNKFDYLKLSGGPVADLWAKGSE